MNYYEGSTSHIFPTFSGQYFQAGLQTLLMPETTNLKGAASLAGVNHDRWDTRSAYGYVLYRLMWDPYDDMEQIARDFCSIHFGPDVAQEMAEIYLEYADALFKPADKEEKPDYAKAGEYYQQALDMGLTPQRRAEVELQLAHCHQESKQYGTAINTLSRLINDHPDSPLVV